MKKTAFWLVPSIAMLLVLLLWKNEQPPLAKPSSSADPLPPQQQQSAALSDSTRIVGQPTARKLPDYIIESNRKRDEFMLKEAEMWTDELKRATVNATMRRVEAALSPLLESWKIDPAKSREVLEIFHKLETASREIYVAHLKNGMKGQPKHKKEQEAEEALANFQLESLVGVDHAGELLKARRDALNRMSAEGISNANASAARKR